jgi:tetratricopeptide (TPR) repeat protein
MKHLQDKEGKRRYRYHQQHAKECIELMKQATCLEAEWSSSSEKRPIDVLQSLAKLYGELGKNEAELHYLKEWYQEIMMHPKHADRKTVSDICYRLGILSEEMGRSQDAVIYHQKELELSQDLASERGPILCNLANAMESTCAVSRIGG